MLKRPVTFTAKSEYFTSRQPAMRLMGRYLRATGQIPVDRAGARAAQATLEAALALLQQGQLFGIYPEGTRSPDGRLYRARPGVGWLAMNSGLPVIPVAMMGTDKVLPPGQSVPRLGKVRIRIGKPMTFGIDGAAQPEEAGGPGQGRGGPSPMRWSGPSTSCPGRSTCTCTRPCARNSWPRRRPPSGPDRRSGQVGRYGPASSSSSGPGSGAGAGGNGSAIPAGFQMYSGPDGESPGRG